MTKHSNNVVPLRPDRAQLLAFIRQGWETLEHMTSNVSWDTSGYYEYGWAWDRQVPVCACATGAGAYAAKVTVSVFEHWLHLADLDARKIADLSDQANDKESALQSIAGYIAYIDGWVARSEGKAIWTCPYNGMELKELEVHAQWHCGFIDCIAAEVHLHTTRRDNEPA